MISPTTFLLQGLALAGKIGAMNYFECSAVTGLGMEEIAREAIRVVEAKRKAEAEAAAKKNCFLQWKRLPSGWWKLSRIYHLRRKTAFSSEQVKSTTIRDKFDENCVLQSKRGIDHLRSQSESKLRKTVCSRGKERNQPPKKSTKKIFRKIVLQWKRGIQKKTVCFFQWVVETDCRLQGGMSKIYFFNICNKSTLPKS